jgi:hypothetical protein
MERYRHEIGALRDALAAAENRLREVPLLLRPNTEGPLRTHKLDERLHLLHARNLSRS